MTGPQPDLPPGINVTAPGIHWSLDPTVAARARFGRHSAEVWCVGPDDQTGWAVFGPGPGYALAQDQADTMDQAKAQAETVMRRLEGAG